MITPLEAEKVRIFLEDEVMVEAVKKILLSVTEIPHTELAKEFSDNVTLGAKTRALAEGKEFVLNGFDKLLEYQRRGIIKKKKNNAI